MKKQEILDIINQNNGYIYKELADKHGIKFSSISRLAKKGLLEKVAPGIYISDNGVKDEFFIASLRYKNIVHSGDSAIFLNNLSNKQFPLYEVTVPYGKSIPKIDDVKVRQTRKEEFVLGITDVETPFGNKVKCYDKERSICDLFIRPDYYDYEDRVYAINEYKDNYLNFKKLYDYAQILGVLKEIKNVFEIIAWD